MTSRPSFTGRHFNLLKDACLEPIVSDDMDAVDPHLIAELAPSSIGSVKNSDT